MYIEKDGRRFLSFLAAFLDTRRQQMIVANSLTVVAISSFALLSFGSWRRLDISWLFLHFQYQALDYPLKR